jgi:serine protease Do
MRRPVHPFFVLLLGAAVAQSVAAQSARVYVGPNRVLRAAGDDQPRAALGITTAGSTNARDTLGLLVSSVLPNSPADKAGIEEGDRIASINGVDLRLDPRDAGDFDISNAMSRRLARELEKVRPGDEVDLRVYSRGERRTVHIRTADSDSLFGRRRVSRNDLDERASLGIGLASTRSRRDTLGVLVMFVDDSGPAARSGIEEGNRIAAINGIDLRVDPADAGEGDESMSKVRRLQRELTNLRPGDDVELRVYADGRFHTVQLRAARASDLSRRRGSFMITGSGFGILPPDAPPAGFNGGFIDGQVREAIEKAMEGANRALQGVGRGLERTRLYFNDDMPDEAPDVEPIEPVHVEPLEPSQLMRLKVPAPLPPIRAAVLGDSDARMTTAAAVAMNEASVAATESGSQVDIAGLRMVPVGRGLASYLGAGSERGLLVLEVPQWARSVIRAGDVVLRVDGRDVRPSPDEVTVALPRFREAQLDILRDGVHHSVTLPARR